MFKFKRSNIFVRFYDKVRKNPAETSIDLVSFYVNPVIIVFCNVLFLIQIIRASLHKEFHPELYNIIGVGAFIFIGWVLIPILKSISNRSFTKETSFSMMFMSSALMGILIHPVVFGIFLFMILFQGSYTMESRVETANWYIYLVSKLKSFFPKIEE